MSLIDEIKVKSLSDAQEILKSAGSEDIFEKAHKDGDIHPNGKWVWVSSAAGGKGDWRTLNGRTHKKHQAANGGGSTGGSSASRNANSGRTVTGQKPSVKNEDKSSKSENKSVKTSSKKSALDKLLDDDPEAYEAVSQSNDVKWLKLQLNSDDKIYADAVRERISEIDKNNSKSNKTNKTETYSHDINGVSVNVSKNKDGSYTLEANGKKVKSDDPSFFKDKLTPRVKKALAKEVGIDVKNPAKQFDIKRIGNFISSIKTTHGDVIFIPKSGAIYLDNKRGDIYYIGDCDEEEKTIELRQNALSNVKRDREAIKEISSALKEKFGFVSKITYEDNPRHGLKKAYMKIVLKPSE